MNNEQGNNIEERLRAVEDELAYMKRMYDEMLSKLADETMGVPSTRRE